MEGNMLRRAVAFNQLNNSLSSRIVYGNDTTLAVNGTTPTTPPKSPEKGSPFAPIMKIALGAALIYYLVSRK